MWDGNAIVLHYSLEEGDAFGRFWLNVFQTSWFVVAGRLNHRLFAAGGNVGRLCHFLIPGHRHFRLLVRHDRDRFSNGVD